MQAETADFSFLTQKLLDNGLSFLLLGIGAYLMWKERQAMRAELNALQAEHNKLRDEFLKESFERENRYATLLKDFKSSLDNVLIEFKSTTRNHDVPRWLY